MQPARPIQLYIALPGRNAAQIDATIAAQNEPGSPAYGRYLTPAQYAAYFGADPRAYVRAIEGLRAAGFVIDDLPANRKDVVAHAPASAIEALFGTPLDVRAERGRVFFTNRFEPVLPAWLAGASVVGLSDFVRFTNDARPGPQTVVNGYKGWAPADIRNVYDLDPIYPVSDGSGVTIGEATVGFATASDFAVWQKRFGLHATLRSVPASTPVAADTDETTLDVDWMAAIAPKATIVQVSPQNNSFQQFTVMYGYFANKLSAIHLVSTSWGACEQYMRPSDVSADESLFAQAQLEGQWWLGDAGDYGSDDCQDGKTVSVNYPASSPHVVSVGGTEVTPVTAGSGTYSGWKSEIVWDTPGAYAGAGGGGRSAIFKKPSFQTKLTPADGRRDVPDVSLMADWNDVNGAYFYYYKGKWFRQWGGTSFATPEWAAFLALVQQRHGKANIANPQARLYALAATTQYHSVFHNIVKGCNALNGVAGFCAKPGYNLASGLGSFIGTPLYLAY